MISISPIPRALVPADSAAATQVSAPNYDEFQSDVEVWERIRERPRSVLRVTMAHADVLHEADIGVADSDASLERAASNMTALRRSQAMRERTDLLFVYEIAGPARPGVRQIGLGGFARTDQIRTPARPAGPIIRNEGIRDSKARGRARLIESTGAIVGMVNNAVPDAEGRLAAALEAYADARAADLTCDSEDGFAHRVWFVERPADRDAFVALMAAEPEAYVADGNHRSAAAAMLGREHFLAVFFPMARMGIGPYNRLLEDVPEEAVDGARLEAHFEIHPAPDGAAAPYQPASDGGARIGLYARGHGWRVLSPRGGAGGDGDAASRIAHAVAQRGLFDAVLGIADERDDRIRYVGANRDAGWLADRVDAGEASLAVTLPPVTMQEFAAVCREGGMMPPKSTWFVPKVRSGLVIALLQ
ncbi:MAG TPA: DUF1015 family protein [Longimicrobiales bacterium]|nr:DUF1015 family protein [Longimicrobiales bacterium]